MAAVTLRRVREVLSNSDCRASLRGKLPREALNPPETPRCGYPQNILKLLGGEDKYINLGIITELLLRRAVIDRAALAELITRVTGAVVPEKFDSPTFLSRVREAKSKMVALAGGRALLYDAAVTGQNVEGHPDARTATDLFEVKTTGRVREDWVQFLLQLFAYAALDSSATRVHLVLPLQGYVWSWELTAGRDSKDRQIAERGAPAGWARREEFRAALEDCAARLTERETRPQAAGDAMALSLAFALIPIGSHIGRGKDLVGMLASVAGYGLPCQLFLGGAATTNVRLDDRELAEARQIVDEDRMTVFVHASYLFNLCALNHYNVPCLTKLLGYARSIGARGVVVHVGKRHCTRTLREGEESGSSTAGPPAAKKSERRLEDVVLGEAEALANMTANICAVVEAASPDCPLLLETPAGQGTETLTEGYEKFNGYCASIGDPCFGMVIDTCHVFAAGVMPREYVEATLNRPEWRCMLKLIHFNDSEQPFNSHKDRHAARGVGFIGGAELHAVAEMAMNAGVPLVCE